MFADTLLQLERAYLEGLMLWGVASVIAGTAVIALVTVRRVQSPLLTHFALQTLLWGSGALAVGAVRWHAVRIRDLAGAAELDRFLWLGAGLDIGIIAVGFVLAAAAVNFGRRYAALGAAIAIVVQGSALFALQTRLMAQLRG
jgi:hypothetical protein